MTNMTTEPLRLPAWVASLLALVILPALAAWLTGVDWRTVLLGVIAAVIPLLGATEAVRALTDSPATRADRPDPETFTATLESYDPGDVLGPGNHGEA